MTGSRTFTLITGASTGIGRELARIAAHRRRNLILVARSENKLDELAKELSSKNDVAAEVIALDLSLPEAPRSLAVEVARRGLDVDTLMNNAGFGRLGPFHETPLETDLEMLRLNVGALTQLTRLFLPTMVSRGRGRILNVASTAGLQPGPLMAVYYASKAYVLSFSEAIAEELRGTGVTVTALLPGPTRTEFQARAEMEGSALVRFGLASARSVAEVGYRAMEAGRPVVIPGFFNNALALTVRFSPRWAVRRVVKRINRVGRGPSH
jgi:short-subunit dehydrogenase